jgi:5-formyltetrahydrofolate cyclo-ligase
MVPKHDLRNEARGRRAELATQQPDFAASVAVFAGTLGIPKAAPVAGYLPFREEADPRTLMRALAVAGHALALPCVVGRAMPLQFRLWREGDPTQLSRHGVPEPGRDRPEIIPGAILVPLLAFDAGGFRLGYGGGYYDRTLAQLRANGPVLAIGVSYAGQEMAALPHEAHDQRLDLMVTERGVRRFES